MSQKESSQQWGQANMRPTLNGTGFMFEILDDYAKEFIAYSSRCDGPVLEIGCAFGVATLPALAAGAQIVACDMGQAHLDILQENVPDEQRENLQCVQGALPMIDFPTGQFSAVLCSRVLHFLDGAAVDASLRKMHTWLKPGGRLYLVADTPYGIWRKYIPVFDAKRARGDRWPGLMIGLENYLPQVPADRSIDGPPFMNLLDPELLERSCRDAGFEVERVSFIDRGDFQGLGRMDGRENAGILASKPV